MNRLLSFCVYSGFIILLQGVVQVVCDLTCPTKFGYFPDPTDCAGYFICTFGNAKTRKCGNGLQYKTTTQTCDVAKADNCEQDGNQANRPKYTGPTMQSGSPSAAASTPASTDDQPSPTPAPFPFETVQATPKTSNYLPAAAQDDQQAQQPPQLQPTTTTHRSPSYGNFKPSFAPRNPTTKRNYDFWKDDAAAVTTTGAPPPQQLRKPGVVNKPFRDNDYVASLKARNTTPFSRFKSKPSFTTPSPGDPDAYQSPGDQQPSVPDVFRSRSGSKSGPQQGSFGTRPDVPNFQFPQQSNGFGTGQDDGGADWSGQSGGVDGGGVWPDQAASQSQPDGSAADSGDKGGTMGSAKSDRRPFPRPSVLIPTDSAMSQCTAEKCQLPNCYCGSTNIPGGLSIADAPQMIVLSFDAEINERNLPIYERLFHKNRKNPNGCNIKATFFVSHEFTNYGMVRYLYEKGHEIASHSITHGVGTGFKDEKSWETEMSGEKSFLASFASIRPDDIKGARAPLLGPGGDDQFQALLNGGFLYDSTLVTPTSSKAPFWPYTMDFAMPHTCVTPPCPQRGYKGLWELPLNPIYGLFGESCYEADRCTFGSTGDDVYKLLYNNFFDHHYSTNKAPFHLAIHADWLKYPPHREAYERFLDVAGTMPDVWIVTGTQAISWMQQPTPVSQLTTFAPWLCSADDASRLPQCDTINACPLPFRDRIRYFYTCSECPAEFPWRPDQ